MSNILVVGSLAYDDVQTPAEHRTNVLGGAASYFAIAARLYAPVRLVGVIGDDFREEDVERLRSRGIDLAGLERRSGGSFRWLGRYDYAMNTAETMEMHALALVLGIPATALAADWNASITGHARTMYESYRGLDFGLGPVDNDDWIHPRARQT